MLLDLKRESLVDSTLFDIRGLVIDILTNDPKLAVDTMIEMGRRTLQPTHTSARPHLDPGFSSARRALDAISTQSRGHLEVVSGRPELQFIRNSGALMGGAFGLVQLAIWAAWPQRAVATFTMPVCPL